MMSTIARWDKDKISELSSQFKTLPPEAKAQVAGVLATNDYGPSIDPNLRGAAISHLIADPANPPQQPNSPDPFPTSSLDITRNASHHAVQWARTDPAAASSWVQSLPEGDEKSWAQKNLAAEWHQYKPQEAAQWVRSLPADNRAAVQSHLENPPGR